jgi:hypothetical protein
LVKVGLRDAVVVGAREVDAHISLSSAAEEIGGGVGEGEKEGKSEEEGLHDEQ